MQAQQFPGSGPQSQPGYVQNKGSVCADPGISVGSSLHTRILILRLDGYSKMSKHGWNNFDVISLRCLFRSKHEKCSFKRYLENQEICSVFYNFSLIFTTETPKYQKGHTVTD